MTTIRELPEQEFRLLLLVALAGPVKVPRLLQLCRAISLKESTSRAYTTDTINEALASLGERVSMAETPEGVATAPEVQTLTLRESVQRDELKAIAPVVRDMIDVHGYYASRNPRTALFDFLVAFHLEQYSNAYDRLQLLKELAPVAYAATEPLFQVVCRPFSAAALEALPSGARGWVLPTVIQRALRLGVCPDPFFEWLCEVESQLMPQAICWVGDLAFLRGDAAVLERTKQATGRSMERHRQAGLALFLQGDMPAARVEFDAFCSALKESTSRRLVPADGLAGVCHVLTLLASADPADGALAAKYVGIAIRDRDLIFGGAFSVLKHVVAHATELENPPERLTLSMAEPDSLFLLLQALQWAWFEGTAIEKKNAAVALRGQSSRLSDSFHWLKRQCAELAESLHATVVPAESGADDANADDANADEANADETVADETNVDEPVAAGTAASEPAAGVDASEAGTDEALAAAGDSPAAETADEHVEEHERPFHPLVDLFSVQPEWATALMALDRIAAVATVDKSSSEQRIVWYLHPGTLDLQPYLQRLKGQIWSSGRKVALKQLGPGGAHNQLLSEHDRRIIEFVQVADGSTWTKSKKVQSLPRQALAALVGHPLVYHTGDTLTPIDVEQGQVTLRAVEENGILKIQTEPPEIEDDVFVEFSLRRAVVYSLTAEQFRMVRVLGDTLEVPASGKSQASEVLARVASAFPVQSDQPSDARQLAADPTPWLRLLPGGAEISVKATVKPLGTLGPALVPGEGQRTLIARLQGETVQALRSLDAEINQVEAIEEACPTLAEASVGDYEWLVNGAENCLALVAELRELNEPAHVEWPKGRGQLKVRGRASVKSLTGHLEKERGWYIATGELKVDDSTQLQLQELLSLYEEHRGRFVPLQEGGYLELEQELRDMLDALSAARDDSRTDEKVGLAACAINAISYFGGEESGLQAAEDVVSWQERVKDAFADRFEVPANLKAELRDYQQEGFEWLCRLSALGFGACLADDMGLGKTVQLIALLLKRASDGPALVVAPTSVCANWREEFERFGPSLRIIDYAGAERQKVLSEIGPGDVIVCSYTLLQQDIEQLHKQLWATAILDEAQFIKNPQSRRAKAAFLLDASVRIAATGTPVENHLGDLWSLFHFINPGLLHSWPLFSRRFVLPIETHKSESARHQLKKLVQPYMLRRTKKQVLSELPPLTEVTLTIPLSQEEAELYEACKRQALTKLQSTKKERREDPRRRFRVLAEITRLRRLCCHSKLVVPDSTAGSAKLDAFLNLVTGLIEGDHRVLVFSQFVDVLGFAKEKLEQSNIKYEYLDGSTSVKLRQSRVAAFQSGSADVFLISLKAGGFGLNLTAADYVIHLDPWWNPAAESQASDRAHRIGQTRPVTVYRLIAKQTVEERILALHAKKRDLADSLLAGADQAARLSEDDLLQLFD